MKRFLVPLLLVLCSFSFGVDVQYAVDAAKNQYGMSDADIKNAAQGSVGQQSTDTTADQPMDKPKGRIRIIDKEADKENVQAESIKNSNIRSVIEKSFPDELKQFGYDIFNSVAVTFAPLKNVPVGNNYLLGSGDQLIINMWGSVQQSFSADIDADGAVILPKLGKVTVAGMTLGNATQLITTLFERNFANFSMDITMGRLKTIEIFVLGDVKLPGRYNLSSLATVLYGLYSAGGPTKLGSLRSIQVIRDQRVFKVVDLYDLLLKGDKSGDLQLRRGDTIFVPKIGDTVAIRGEIKTPAIYEIGDNSSLHEIIAMAGEHTRHTYIKEINITRKDKVTNTFKLKTFSFKNLEDFVAQSKKIALEDGDIVDLKAIDNTLYDWVKIDGSVKFPGQYDYSRADNLDALVKLAGGTKDVTFLIEITRTDPLGVLKTLVIPEGSTRWELVSIQPKDEVKVYSIFELMASKKTVKALGAVKNPGEYPFADGMTATQLIMKAGGFSPSSDPTEIRVVQNGADGNMIVTTVNVNDKDQVQLLPDAQVYVAEKSVKNVAGSVTIRGQVNVPGKFPIYNNETFSQFIKRIGGFSTAAYVPGVALYRQYREGKQFIALSKETGVLSSNYMNIIVALSDFTRLRVNFMRLFRDNRQEDDVVLKDGDVINVPDIPTEIKVVGGVYNQGSFLFRDGVTLGSYLNYAGNFRTDGDGPETFVAHIDGTVTKTYDPGYRIERGDNVIVPIRVLKDVDVVKSILDWTQIIFNVATVWKVVFSK